MKYLTLLNLNDYVKNVRCHYCDSGKKITEEFIKENGQLIVDEESRSFENSSGKKIWEYICEGCRNNYQFDYHWIPDNYGYTMTVNGIDSNGDDCSWENLI